MKKGTASALVLMLLILAGTSFAALEMQGRISSEASDNVWYVGQGFQFSTIQQAINYANVSDGDTIEVFWNYTSPPIESVVVNKTLTIEPYSADPLPPTVFSFLVEAPSVEINGFIVTHAIYLNSSNNLIVNNTASEVDIGSGSNNTLIQNSLSNFIVEGPFYVQNIDDSNTLNGKPIYYWVNEHDMTIPANAGYVGLVNSANITAENLLLGPNMAGDGVLVVNSTVVTIANVSLTSQSTGIFVADSSQITETDLAFQTPQTILSNHGVVFNDVNNSNVENSIFNFGTLATDTIWLSSSRNNTIEGNTLYSPLSIVLNSSDGNLITDNVINHVGPAEPGVFGIVMSSSNDNAVVANNISKTSIGLAMESSDGNMFFHNNFINNTYQAEDFGGNVNNSFDNGYEGNFWSDYVGTDLLGRGIGDTPYSVGIDLGNDDYPLMMSWSENRVYERQMATGSPDLYPEDICTFSNCTLGLWPALPAIAAGFTVNRTFPPTITLNATCGYSGFMNITIPRDWIDGPFTVTVDDVLLNSSSYSSVVDQNTTSIYLTFDSGEHTVEISGLRLGSIPGDLNGDGVVNILDAILFSNVFGSSELGAPFPTS